MRRGALLLSAALLCGCATPAPPSSDTAGASTIYVVRHGGHAGLVVRASEVPEAAWPARRDFPDAQYFEVGWGDRDYYMASDPGIWLGLKALFWPTASALHVVAFSGAVQRYFPASEIVALSLSEPALAQLVARVQASHELDADGMPVALGPGLYGESRFYASRETFHLFKTCNVWTAQQLRAAGVAVKPALSLTAGMLFTQLRGAGRAIAPSAHTCPPASSGPGGARKDYALSACLEPASNK